MSSRAAAEHLFQRYLDSELDASEVNTLIKLLDGDREAARCFASLYWLHGTLPSILGRQASDFWSRVKEISINVSVNINMRQVERVREKTIDFIRSAQPKPEHAEVATAIEDKRTPKAEDLLEQPLVGSGTATTNRIRSGPYTQSSVSELVQMATEGATEAYDELVMRFQNGVKNKAMKVVRDYQVAEDLAQEAFIKAYRSLFHLQDPRKFGPWIQTIVQHTAMDFVRARRESQSLEQLSELGHEVPTDTRGLQLEKVLDREEDEKVLEELSKLREDYRDILVLKHVDGLSYKDIAERLNMSVSAVGEKLSRVRKILDEKLHKRTH